MHAVQTIRSELTWLLPSQLLQIPVCEYWPERQSVHSVYASSLPQVPSEVGPKPGLHAAHVVFSSLPTGPTTFGRAHEAQKPSAEKCPGSHTMHSVPSSLGPLPAAHVVHSVLSGLGAAHVSHSVPRGLYVPGPQPSQPVWGTFGCWPGAQFVHPIFVSFAPRISTFGGAHSKQTPLDEKFCATQSLHFVRLWFGPLPGGHGSQLVQSSFTTNGAGHSWQTCCSSTSAAHSGRRSIRTESSGRSAFASNSPASTASS